MSHAHSTTKRRTFKHLNAYQRGQIEAMLRLGVPKVKIAKDLGIARSTLYEEIKRSTVAQKRSDWTYYEQYKVKSIDLRQKYAVVSAKRKRTMTTAGRSVRVLTAVTLLLTNAPPLEIGNLTPSSRKRERILFCLP
ncbi:ISSag3 transposase [Centipeda periodontii DSM 2778]|uniref:ISSag3 transposase n=1 Tax=Centipeda periodontii DSM 2778 TaxID=888060 RepID=F5RMM0_9FIRM|nr:helix-turn-helix domain-containing protein [Centipeda periodontii]EGK59518.1 ISSag3 transposase [Centipeda periodontii DSM 2778]